VHWPKQIITIWLTSMLVIISLSVYAGSMQDAHNSGATLGNNKVQMIHDNINTPKALDVIPGFTTIPTVPSQSGVSKIINCQGVDIDSLPPQQKIDCQAILHVTNNPTTRPQFTIPSNDPLRTKKDDILADPESVAGQLSGQFSECTAVEETTEDKTEYKYCDETTATGTANECPVVLEIETESTFTYDCTESPNKLTEYTCKRNRIITVNQPPDVYNFTPGARAGGTLNVMDGCGAIDHYIGRAYYGTSDAYMRVQWWANDRATKWINMNPNQTYNLYSYGYSGCDSEMNTCDSIHFQVTGKYWCSGNSCYVNGRCDVTQGYGYIGGGMSYNTYKMSSANLSFPRAIITPQDPYIETETWDNQCAGLEAKSQ